MLRFHGNEILVHTCTLLSHLLSHILCIQKGNKLPKVTKADNDAYISVLSFILCELYVERSHLLKRIFHGDSQHTSLHVFLGSFTLLRFVSAIWRLAEGAIYKGRILRVTFHVAICRKEMRCCQKVMLFTKKHEAEHLCDMLILVQRKLLLSCLAGQEN